MQLTTKEIIFTALIFLIGLAVYSSSLTAPFVFDDSHVIVDNNFIKNPSLFKWFFKGYITSFSLPRGMCRPLLMLTFAFNYASSGLNPISYHITNVFFHIINSILLFFLLLQLLPKAPRGLLLFLGTLFLIHPVNSEAVTYLSSRSDLMTGLFILSGFILHLNKRWLFSLLFYLSALLTKETALCFPLLVFAYDFIFLGFKNKSNINIKKRLPFYLGLILLTGLYFVYKSTIFAATPTHFLRSAFSNILTQSAVTLLYLKLFILPFGLNILHFIPKLTSLTQILSLISLSSVIGLIITAILLIKKKPLVSLGISWLLIGLAPKFYARLNFVAMEHHFYLPSMGIYIILAVILFRIYSSRKKYFVYIFSGILILFSLLTWLRNYEYRNSITFWSKASQRNSRSGTIYLNLGLEYLKKGYLKEAKDAFIKALDLSQRTETSVYARINLATIYIAEKDYQAARKEINEAFTLTKLPAPALYQNLGVIEMKLGNEKEAIAAWNKEIEYYPGHVETYLNLGIYYSRINDLRQAKIALKRAITVASDNYAGYYGLGQVFQKENNTKDAIAMYEQAIKYNTNDAASHYFLGTLYAKTGDQRALSQLSITVKLMPEFAQAHNDLAVCYASLKPPRWELAQKHANIALSLGYKVKEDFLKLIKDQN